MGDLTRREPKPMLEQIRACVAARVGSKRQKYMIAWLGYESWEEGATVRVHKRCPITGEKNGETDEYLVMPSKEDRHAGREVRFGWNDDARAVVVWVDL